MAETQDQVYHFKDESPEPDLFMDYHSSLLEDSVPLVIDNGTYKCRAGWASKETPSLIFKNLTAKQRGKKLQNDVEIQIGNDITNMDVARCVLRSQFDRNLVTLYDVQEQIFDYLFSHMGISTEEKVDHPIVMTEAVCNPNYCRQLMSEMLFECYHVPQVTYGIDSLFSLYYNHPSPETANALLVDCGYQATHIIPVVGGCLDSVHTRRVNIGGAYIDWFLQRLLQLKYPGHLNTISLARAEEIIRDHCYMSIDFPSELSMWSHNDYFDANVRKIQLPMAQLQTNPLSSDQQKDRRKQQISRLQEVNAKRRLERLQVDETELQKLLEVQELILTEEDDSCLSALSKVGFTKVEDLQAAVDKLSSVIQRTKAKILGQEPAPIESESKEPSFPLLDIPDEMLTPDQLTIKKRQKILKSAREGRNRVLALQREKRKKELEEDKKLEERRRVDFKGWLEEVRSKRQKILDARNVRRQRKSDMAKRRTFASQQRMRIISQLAAQPSKKGDNFGQNDADWDVYKEINRETGTSDSEAEEETLEELETALREFDPEFQKEMDMKGLSNEFDIAEYHRLHLGVERMRVSEVLFQPSMLGIDQAGVTETMDFILGKMDAGLQDRLVQHIFLTGGNASFNNFKSRMMRDLQEIRPFQSSFQVSIANNPSLDAWHGARKFALSPHMTTSAITRKDYEEMGEGYLKEHIVSNAFFSSPGMLFKND